MLDGTEEERSRQELRRWRRRSEELSELEEEQEGERRGGEGETGLMRYFLQINHPCTLPLRRKCCRRLDTRRMRAHYHVCFLALAVGPISSARAKSETSCKQRLGPRPEGPPPPDATSTAHKRPPQPRGPLVSATASIIAIKPIAAT